VKAGSRGMHEPARHNIRDPAFQRRGKGRGKRGKGKGKGLEGRGGKGKGQGR